MWTSNRIDLGKLKEGSVNKFNFHALYPLEIEKIKPGCSGCTKAQYDGKYFLKVTFTPNKIPKHIRSRQNYQNVTKTIIVTYKDGKQEVLTFTAIIIK